MDGLFDLLFRCFAHDVVTKMFWWKVSGVAPLIEKVEVCCSSPYVVIQWLGIRHVSGRSVEGERNSGERRGDRCRGGGGRVCVVLVVLRGGRRLAADLYRLGV